MYTPTARLKLLQRLAPIRALLWLLLAAGPALASTPEVSPGNGPTLGTALNPDGTLRPGASGSFDARQFAFSTAPDGRPVFRPSGTAGAGDYKWQNGFGLPEGVAGNVKAVVRVGSDMYIGGNFTAAGHAAASHVARWDGTTWHPLSTGVNGYVRALAVAPNGDVYVGGQFTRAGGIVANGIAKWNGTAWSALGTGAQNGINVNPGFNVVYSVYALAVAPNGDLYVGGDFTRAGGAAISYLARWDGTAWSALGQGPGSGTDGVVNALAVAPNGDVYAGGPFSRAGGVPAAGVARWNGSAWSALGSGIASFASGGGGIADALAVAPNGDVYVGGDFSFAGGAAAHYIARWNGTAWSPLGAGFNTRVLSLAFGANGELYAGGNNLSSSGTLRVNGVAKWNGTAWSSAGPVSGNLSAYVYGLAFGVSGEPWAVGQFDQLAGTPAHAVARWASTTWAAVGTGQGNGVYDEVRAVAVAANGDVYVGGRLSQAGGLPIAGLAKWNGSAWSAVGTGTNTIIGTVNALTIAPNGDVYVGVEFGGQASHVVRWNGTTWSTLGSGTAARIDGPIYALAIGPNGDVYAAGNFYTVGGVTANNIARWDGTAWSTLGNGFSNTAPNGNSTALALAFAPNGDLYAGGRFTSPGTNVARWNGTTWNSLGTGTADGVDREVAALAVAPNGDVFVGGYFTRAGGASANGIARWNGTAWSTLGTGAANGVAMPGNFYCGVFALAVGSTGDLYVGGNFSQAGGAPANHIARWDGTSWSSTLGSGLNNTVRSLALMPGNKLCFGGLFSGVGDASKASVGFAVYDPNATPTATVAGRSARPGAGLHPNPATGKATLTLPPATQARPGQVLDALGRVVGRFVVPAGAGSATLNLAGLPPGAYTARVGGQQARLLVE